MTMTTIGLVLIFGGIIVPVVIMFVLIIRDKMNLACFLVFLATIIGMTMTGSSLVRKDENNFVENFQYGTYEVSQTLAIDYDYIEIAKMLELEDTQNVCIYPVEDKKFICKISDSKYYILDVTDIRKMQEKGIITFAEETSTESN